MSGPLIKYKFGREIAPPGQGFNIMMMKQYVVI